MIEDLSTNISTISANSPVVSSKSEEYKPTPYTFRIPSNTFSPANGPGLVRCPPFYVQLDHALSVIWSLFSKQTTKKQLGLVQLQWALNFLQGIRNSKGKHPKDVAVCIAAIEGALIEQYAAMLSTVKPQSSTLSISERSANSGCWTTCRKSKQSLASVENSSSLLGDKKSFLKHEPNLLMQKFPFSVTYAEMSKRRPNFVEQLYKAKGGISKTGTDIQQQFNNLKNTTDSEIALDATYSREGMVECLKAWHNEQINKLQSDLQTLHSIERFIGSVDKDHFHMCLDNEQLTARNAKKSENYQSSHLSVKSNAEYKKNIGTR